MPTKLDVAEACLLYGIHIPTRTIQLSGPVDEGMRDRLLAGLKLIDAPHTTLTVELDTEGGNLYEGLTIYDALRACKASVRVIGYGKIMSMGVTILQAADEGQRILMPHCTVMIHRGYAGVAVDHEETAKRIMREYSRIGNVVDGIVAERMNLSVKKYRELCKFDIYYDARQAVERGLADEIYKF